MLSYEKAVSMKTKYEIIDYSFWYVAIYPMYPSGTENFEPW